MMAQSVRQQLFTAASPTVTRIIPELAKEIGLNESIMLLQLDFWINSTDNHQDGKWWTFQSIRDMQEKAFPYWSTATINRTVQALESIHLIIIGNYNKRKGDNTRWLTLDYKNIGNLHSVKVVQLKPKGVSKRDTLSQNETPPFQNETPLSQNETTLPETPTEIPTETPSEREDAPAPSLAVLPEMIAANEGLRIVTPIKEDAQTLPNAENPLSSSAALSPKEIPLEEVKNILASQPHMQRSELQNIYKLPMTEAYARALGQEFVPSNAEKLTALRLQVSGYTPDDVFALVTEKLKTKPGYAFNFVQSDLPIYKRNLSIVPKSRAHDDAPPAETFTPPDMAFFYAANKKVSGDENGTN